MTKTFEKPVGEFISAIMKKEYSKAEKSLQDCIAIKLKERISNTLVQK